MPHNPHADFTPTLAGYSGITPFRFWCQTALPLTYDDSLSYYELLNKVVNYLNNTIDDLTNVENNTSELNDAYVQLQNYVNNYFDDIDIEAELRNVLDGMAEDGTLDALLNPLVENQLPDIVDEKIDAVVADQIDAAVAGQIDESVEDQLPALVDAGIPEEVSGWLTENVDPVGSAVMVDSSLTISGAAADAKVTGDEVSELKEQLNGANIGRQFIAGNLSYGVMVDNFPAANPRKYYAVMMDAEVYDRDITITAESGYEFLIYYYDQNDDYVRKSANWITSRLVKAGEYFRLWIRETLLDTSTVFDLRQLKYNFYFNSTIEDEIEVNENGIDFTKRQIDHISDGVLIFDTDFVHGRFVNNFPKENVTAYKYQAVTPNVIKVDKDITIKARSGYTFQAYWYDAQDAYVSRNANFITEYTMPSGTRFRLWVRPDPLDTTADIDPITFQDNIVYDTGLQEEIDGIDNVILKLTEGALLFDTEFAHGTTNTTTGEFTPSDSSYKYQAITPNIITFDKDIVIKANSGYQFQAYWYDTDDTYISRNGSFQTEFLMPANRRFRLFMRLDPHSTSANVDVETFRNNIFYNAEIQNEIVALYRNPLTNLPSYIKNTLAQKAIGTLSKGYILLTCDDGTEGLATYTIPMLINKGVPATFGLLTTSVVITNASYLATLIDAVENHGCCVAQHGSGSAQWPTYSEYELNKYFDTTESTFTAAGITEIHGAICPGGAGEDTSELVMAIAGGRFGAVFSGGTHGEITYGSYNASGPRTNMYAMNRKSAIGFANAADYEAAIDDAYDNHYILCPFWHDYTIVDNQGYKDIIEGMIDYAKTKGLTFITMKDLPSIK